MFLEFFQLHEQPFGVTPDPAYLYPSQTHCEALDSLTEAILGDRGFLALIAEPGMGKTTLLYQVLEGMRESARAVFLFQTQCSSREFFQYLMNELGVDYAGMGVVAMHSKLNELLFAEMLAGRRFVLIVDEAQNLDDSVLETIRMLSNFETAHAKLLQIVLAGQPQLGEKLKQPHLAQLRQRIATVQYLHALTYQETAGYIEHRLRVAGHRGGPLFEPEALSRIAEVSGGVPRLINKICFRAMLEAYGRGRSTVSIELVEKAGRLLEISSTTRLPAASGPLPISTPLPVSTPEPPPATMAAAAGAESVTEMDNSPAATELTYRQSGDSGKPRWGPWVAGLAVVLLGGGLALPHNLLRETVQKMREKVVSTGNLVRGEGMINRQAIAGGEAANVSKTSGESAPVGTAMPNVTGIQTTSHENDAQIVVLLDGPVQYDSARISSPDRIYFDLHNARLNPAVEQKAMPAEGGLVKWVRAAQNSDDVVRLVLLADGAKDYSAQFLSEPNRLVIDVHGDPAAVPSQRVGAGVPAGANTGMAGQLSLTRELGLKISRIVIDAGHGGYDTGTTGPRGLLEKNLCLDVALRLGRLIEENIPGAQVVYTRKDDSFVPLEERTTMANDANADLFISIHANSSESKEIRGVETYYMSLATTREARELAAHENTFGQSSLHDLPGLIRKITSNEKIAESRQLAGDIQNALSLRLQSVSRQEINRGVKRAPFLVLTGANMPAALSEISFVSNASDENLLLESTQRERVAEGLYRGIAAYLDSMHTVPQKKQKIVTENRTSASSGPGF